MLSSWQNEQDTQPEVAKDKSPESNQLTEKQKEIEQHKTNIELQKYLEEIELNLEIESKEKQELKEWSVSLVKSVGPSIWYPSEWQYPLPHKRLNTSNIQDIIKELNLLYEQERLPQIIFKKIEGKTIFISPSNSDQLTENMGSFGARSYMNSVTYTLTSVKEIDCVFFEFEPGDHAFPGKYCLEEINHPE